MYAEQVEILVKKYLAYGKATGKEVGIHAHNNQQLAFANTIEAIIHGANRMDASMGGLGRGAGNCPMELLIGFLRNPKFKMRPIVQCVQEQLLPLSRRVEWGPSVQYNITGQLNEHPAQRDRRPQRRPARQLRGLLRQAGQRPGHVMCGRFTLRTPAAAVAKQFGLLEAPPFAPRYNVAPSQPVAVVRLAPAEAAPRRQWTWLRWGLVPSWAKDPSIGNRLINARAETAAEKPAFRAALRHRRCLVVADGFYEWQHAGGRNNPITFGCVTSSSLVSPVSGKHGKGPKRPRWKPAPCSRPRPMTWSARSTIACR